MHHSANREFDLVDAAETARPQSDAVLLGNIIVKDPKCSGNHTTIHFGQDGGKPHNGTLYLAFNTVVTPFISPVVELSTAGAKARLLGNVVGTSIMVGGTRQAGQKVAGVRGGAAMQNIGGESNWFCGDFSVRETGLDAKSNHFETAAGDLFLGSRDDNYRLALAGRPKDDRCLHGRVAGPSRGARDARHGGPAALGPAVSSSGRKRETPCGSKALRPGPMLGLRADGRVGQASAAMPAHHV